MLDQVVSRIDRQLRRMGEQIKDKRHLDWCLSTGNNTAYQIRDKAVFFKTLVDLDSFLFESRSIYEIVGKFLQEFFKQILRRNLSENKLKSALTRARIDVQWIDELRENRILFFHETAPWVAAHVVSRTPLKLELVVLKKNFRQFTNPKDYVHFEQLRNIYRGFRSAMPAMYQWVESQVAEFEARDAGTKPH
jgi:hypothetical protein